MKAHDFQVNSRFNNVLVTVTNSAFPLIEDITPEERQARADLDELSTKEVPLIFIDNTSVAKKVKETNRNITGPYQDLMVKRDDIRVQVRPSLKGHLES